LSQNIGFHRVSPRSSAGHDPSTTRDSREKFLLAGEIIEWTFGQKDAGDRQPKWLRFPEAEQHERTNRLA
jgi:hypothetical protein